MDFMNYITLYPRGSIILMALAISFLISLVNYFFLDKERLRELKEKQKKLQEEIKQHQKDGNTDKMLELQKEMFSGVGETFKHSMRPMLITLIPILILFAFIRNAYAETSIAGSWFWYYLVTAMVGSIIFKKLFKLP
jgi:uncharacterized membrane protein (DUF106 family)